MTKNKRNTDYLYYSSTIGSNIQPTDATGLIDPEAAHSQTNNCWIADTQEDQITPKNIIINCLTLNNLRNHEVIKKLVAQGFKVYAYNRDRKILENYDYTQIVKLEHEKEIGINAAKIQFSADNSFIINDSNFEKLKWDLGLTEKEPNPTFQIDINDLAQDFSTLNFSEIEYIKTVLPKDVKLVFNKKIFDRKNKVRVDNKQGKLRYFEENIEKMFGKKPEIIEEAKSKTAVPRLNLESSDTSADELSDSLKSNQHIETLILSDCPNLSNGELDLKKIELNKLRRIDLSGSNMSMENLAKLLEKCPNLEIISLESYFVDVDLAQFKSDKLKQINLSTSGIQVENLIKILENFPNLETLNLNGYNKLKKPVDLTLFKSTKLKILELRESQISSENLTKLLISFPNIERFSLSYFVQDTPVNLEGVKLHKLKELNFTSSLLSTPNLQRFLEKCPNLESADLSGYKTSIDLGNVKLNKLTALDLSHSKITQKDLHNIFRNCPNLEMIGLSKCSELLNEPLDFGDLKLDKLKRIDLTDSNINPENLSKLLAKCPNLEIIDLGNCKNLENGRLNLDGVNLDKLRELNLQKTKLSSDNLSFLLAKCPNIEKPILDENAALNDEILGATQFPYLYEIKAPTAVIKQLQARSRFTLQGSNYSNLETKETKDETSYQNYSMRNPNIIRGRSNKIVDGNVEEKGKNELYEQEHLFTAADRSKKPININHYRLEVFNKLSPDGGLKTILNESIMIPQRNISEDIALQMNTNTASYKGSLQLRIDGEWTALPSLSTHDDLLAFKATNIDNDAKLNSNDFDIRFDPETRFHYIRTTNKSTQKLALDFVIKPSSEIGIAAVKTNVDKLNNPLLKFIIKKYQAFREGTLNDQTIIDNCQTPKEILDKIRDLRAGSCRHRAWVAFDEIIQNINGVKCQMIYNDNHAYIEVDEGTGELIKIDLGGTALRLAVGGKIVTNSQTPSVTIHTKVPQIVDQKTPEELSGPFAVWQKNENPYKNIEEFNKAELINSKHFQETKDGKSVQNSQSKLLTLFNSEEELVNYRTALLHQLAQDENVEYIYVNSDAELSLKKPNVIIDENNNAVKTAETVKLHQFISSAPKAGKKRFLVLANSDSLKYNTILDRKRKLDGVAIADDIMIIGLHNCGKPDSYKGADFFSRYGKDRIKTPPTNLVQPEELDKFKIEDDEEIIAAKSAVMKTKTIDLYNSNNWKNILLHQFFTQGENIKYEEGELVKAIEGNNHIILQNAPWHNPEFVLFINQILTKKSLEFYGKNPPLPQGFTISKTFKDHKNDLHDFIKSGLGTVSTNLESPYKTVTSSNSWQLLRSCEFDKEKGEFNVGKGIISLAQNGELNLFITSTLSLEQFSNIFKEAKEFNVKLNFTIAKNVNLPFNFLENNWRYNPYNPFRRFEEKDSNLTAKPQIIKSNDVDFAIIKLKSSPENKDAVVIDISELSVTNLFDSTQNETGITGKLKFSKIDGLINKLLKEGKKVILKGNFSQVIADKIAEMPYNPNLTIVTQDDKYFQFCKIVEMNFTNIDKFAHFSQRLNKLPENARQKFLELQNKETSYTFLNSSLRYLEKNPHGEISDLHKGLESIETKHDLSNYNINRLKLNDEEIAKKFDEDRLSAVENVLSYSPHVFIAGKTGVGKSEFIKNILGKKHHVYFQDKTDKEQLINWQKNAKKEANDDPNKLHILFIDEANLTNTDYSIFEGLHEIPPHIVIDNEYLELPQNCRVALAGNPQSYGDRKTPSLLKRHGGATIFHELLPEYIFHKILKPVLQSDNPFIITNIDGISRRILAIYQIIVNLSDENNVLISPRELQMMALSATAPGNKNTTQKLYFIAESLIPDDKKQAFNIEFEKAFSCKIEELTQVNISPEQRKKIDGKNFTLTQSREKAYAIFDDFLNIRQSKIDYKGTVESKKYGGLGGIIIEGEPGTGKSEFVKQFLKKEGFIDAAKFEKNYDKKPEKKPKPEFIKQKQEQQKVFVVIAASLPEAEKIQKLRDAFKEGHLVLMDEINSQPMLESLLNDLLMGVDPYKKAKDGIGRPEKAGFGLIATQNPIHMAGRKITSLALERRNIKIKLPPHSQEEIEEIIIKKETKLAQKVETKTDQPAPPNNLSPEARTLLNYYGYAYQYAVKNGLEPPTLRDFVKEFEKLKNIQRPDPNIKDPSISQSLQSTNQTMVTINA